MSKRSSARRTCALTLAAGLVIAGFTSQAVAAPQPEPLPLDHPGIDVSRIAPPDTAARTRAAKALAPQRQAYLLKLDVRSTAKAYRGAGRGAAGKRAARAQLDKVESVQDQVIADLPARTAVLYRTHALLSGVAVTARAGTVDTLGDIDGVAGVYPIAPKTPSLSTSIPLQGGPTTWTNFGTGDGVKIAIIDSGVDYTHADFGGQGTVNAFEAAKTIDDKSWVTTKVVDGYDFVGDAYDPDKGHPPVPDPNPLDCGGHGSHVAGIAAGQGVTTGRQTYPGPYDVNIDYKNLSMGPGMAPRALLYAYKVFGCQGSTEVVGEAIDRAADPNNDGDTSDHVDVINMSLGSDYGSADDADSLASDAAVDAGIIVVASAGNGGDLTDVAGSPANATKAISVANSVDAQSILDGAELTIDAAQDRYAVTRSTDYDWDAKSDLTGPVVAAPASNPDACQPFVGEDFTGKVVLVTWTQEALECGSRTRGGNLRAANAAGFILANSAETFDAGILGDTLIPGVLMVKSGGDAIRAALLASKPVTVDGTTVNSVVQELPENTDKVSNSSSRGIHQEGNVKPDIAAVGETVFSVAVGTGTEGVTETGTSMSGPTVAGLAALVRQAHPSWAPEQVKASIMNNASDLFTGGLAGGDRYAPIRVGAGRIQAEQAVDNTVTAYVADDPGSVSVSFGPVEVDAPMTLTKTVNVTNHGLAAATYQTSIDELTSVNGTGFTVSPASVTVAPGATEQVTVTFHASGRADLDNAVDPTVGRDSVADGPRSTMAEASGHLLLTPAVGNTLRVPVYAAPRPVSDLSGGDTVALDPTTHKGQVTISGVGLGFGVNGTTDTDPTNDINSIGAAFELAVTSPVLPECTSPGDVWCWALPVEQAADIRKVGVNTAGDMAYFAVNVDQPWNTPAGVTDVEVLIDVDGDGLEDLLLYNTRAVDTDVMLAALVDLTSGDVVDANYLNGLSGTVDTAQYDSDTMILPLWLPALEDYGITAANPRITYAVGGWSAYAEGYVDLVGYGADGPQLSVDLFQPGLMVEDNNGQPMYFETNGTTLTVTKDPSVYTANDSKGLMLVHLHNAVGAKTEVLDVAAAPGTTSTALSASASSVELGRPVAFNVAVTGDAPVTGTVRVLSAETGAVLTSGTVDDAGKASLTYTPTATGTVRVVARYDGDPVHAPSTSADAVVTVTANPTAAATTTTLAVRPAKVVRGAPVTLDVAVASGKGTPSGPVSVIDQATGKAVATGDLSGGRTSLTFTPKTPATMTLQAIFTADATFAASQSPFAALVVRHARADVSLKLSRKAGAPRQKVTATIKVDTVNGIKATGRVKLIEKGDVVGKAKLDKGKAKLNYDSKKVGTHTLRAVYGGDATYADGRSPKVEYTVRKG